MPPMVRWSRPIWWRSTTTISCRSASMSISTVPPTRWSGKGSNPSRGGDGLPAYSAQQRKVTGSDIVLWYTMGFHHLTRPEDWPILSTIWHSVSLVPYGFFDHNPSLDLRRDFAPIDQRKE